MVTMAALQNLHGPTRLARAKEFFDQIRDESRFLRSENGFVMNQERKEGYYTGVERAQSQHAPPPYHTPH